MKNLLKAGNLLLLYMASTFFFLVLYRWRTLGRNRGFGTSGNQPGCGRR